MSGVDAATSTALEAEAFKRIYPESYFQKFLEHGVRPDGRPLGQSRPVSVALGVVTSADASALVKIGSTTVLAGVKCEIMAPVDESPNEGQVLVEVEMAPLSEANARPGRPSEAATILSEQIHSLISQSGILDMTQLCIDPGSTAWAAYIDIYVLDSDGALHDACVLAAVAALSSLHLPRVSLDENGAVQPESKVPEGGFVTEVGIVRNESPMKLHRIPLSLTIALHSGKLLVDPSAEEESLAESLVTVVVDEDGRLMSISKPGGGAALALDGIRQCQEAARVRASVICGLLREAIDTYEKASLQ